MFKKKNIPLIVLSILILLMVVVELMRPKEIDWTTTYSRHDKIPYGTYVFFELLPEVFGNKEIQENNMNVYDLFLNTDSVPKNYIFINDVFLPDDWSLDYMLRDVEMGSSVFIAATDICQKMKDTFNIQIDYQWNDFTNFGYDTISLALANKPVMTDKQYSFTKTIHYYYFSSIDTANTEILGYQNKIFCNFIKIKHGAGNIYINMQPLAFTNYNILLHDNYEYAFKAMSYMPVQPVVWDEYYKPQTLVNMSPLRYILKNKALEYGLYTLLITVLIFTFFHLKRRQRIIPIIEPPKNTSLEFSETIGRLYFHSKNHKDIATKKMMYFMDYLRSKYFIKIKHISDIDAARIAEKTGVDKKLISDIFLKAQVIDSQKQISVVELYVFTNLIEDFYQKCQ